MKTSIVLLLVGSVGFTLPHQAADQSGEEVYVTYCSACHGQSLEGGRAPSLVRKTWKYGPARPSILKSVKEGIAGTEMPKWEGVLIQKEMEAVTDYVLTMQPGDKPAKKPE